MLMNDRPHEFITLNIFDQATREKFKEVSPLLKIPVLQDGQQVVYDSRQIFRYLTEKGFHRKLTWDEENALTVMDEFAASLLTLLLMRRSNMTLTKEGPFGVSHLERIDNTLDFLETQCSRGYFDDWNFLSMSLFAFLDWIYFRELTPLGSYKELAKFHNREKSRPIVTSTDPRLG